VWCAPWSLDGCLLVRGSTGVYIARDERWKETFAKEKKIARDRSERRKVMELVLLCFVGSSGRTIWLLTWSGCRSVGLARPRGPTGRTADSWAPQGPKGQKRVFCALYYLCRPDVLWLMLTTGGQLDSVVKRTTGLAPRHRAIAYLICTRCADRKMV